MKKNLLALGIMMIVIPLAGELKFYPFGSGFRISISVPLFFLLLMWIRKIPLFAVGISIGTAVVAFRVGLVQHFSPMLNVEQTLFNIIPAFFYYVTFALLFQGTHLSKRINNPVAIVGLTVLIDACSSYVELGYRWLALGESISLLIVGEVVLIAFVRSFFTLSFFFILRLREVEVLSAQKTAQNEQMLLLISNLYQESIQLKKTLVNAETITRECYGLYRTLKDTPANELDLNTVSKDVLSMAGQIHDIKKDNQKIVSGLSKLINEEKPTDYLKPSDICRLIVDTNQKYADALNKAITFNFGEVNVAFAEAPPMHVFTLMSLLNNLVVNAVEAIDSQGEIYLEAMLDLQNNHLIFKVKDSGCGISETHQTLIFEPGYTSKYDKSGNPSTGIGLTYVRELAEQLGGELTLVGFGEKTMTEFLLTLPADRLTMQFRPIDREEFYE